MQRDITKSRADALGLRQLTETIDDVFYVHEIDDGKISYVSPAYEKIWMRSRDTLYADRSHLLSVVHPDDPAKFEAIIAPVCWR